MPSLDLDFFGVGTRIVVPDSFDERHFRYYFGYFVREISEPPAVELHFTTRPDGSFVKSLLNKETLKVSMVREGDGPWRIHDMFTDRSTQPSPLPPFQMAAFSSRFTSIHAASVVHPRTGEAALLIGPSFSGKSVLTLELLRRGWGFLSDDMSIIQRDGVVVWAFPRPIGIRENTRKLLPWIDERVAKLDGVRRIQTPSGETLMVRVEDLFPGVCCDSAPLRHLIELDRSDDTTEISWVSQGQDICNARVHELLATAPPPTQITSRRVTYNLEHHAGKVAAELETILETPSS